MTSLLTVALCFVTLFDATAAPAATSATDWENVRRFRFEYQAELTKLDVADGAQVRVWIPHPWEGDVQRIGEVAVTSPWDYQVTTDSFGNRTIYLEGSGPVPADVTVAFDIERLPYTGVGSTKVVPGGTDDPARYLAAPRLIPLQGTIEDIAEQVGGKLESKSEKAWAFYDYVYRTMSYDKSGDGWGRGDAVWACTNKRGNCTDFHSLFMGMALSQDIPARFMIGFPIPANQTEGTVGGYHCWAEYFDELRGWLPLDASEAKKSGHKAAYFGTLPNDRVRFTIGRDLTLEPAQDAGPLNYFIYPYVEVDSEPVETTAKFSFTRPSDGAAPAEAALHAD